MLPVALGMCNGNGTVPPGSGCGALGRGLPGNDAN